MKIGSLAQLGGAIGLFASLGAVGLGAILLLLGTLALLVVNVSPQHGGQAAPNPVRVLLWGAGLVVVGLVAGGQSLFTLRTGNRWSAATALVGLAPLLGAALWPPGAPLTTWVLAIAGALVFSMALSPFGGPTREPSGE